MYTVVTVFKRMYIQYQFELAQLNYVVTIADQLIGFHHEK